MEANTPTGVWPRAERVSAACGVLLVTIGVLVLVGWVIDSEQLKRLILTLPAMKALTAVTFILAGLALILLRPASLTADRLIGRWLGFAVALIGVLVICEYLFGSIGIDQLFFRDRAADTPGRPAPHTAVGFITLGLGLFFADRGAPGYRAEQTFIVLTTVVGVVALVGYTYDVDYLRAISSATGMAIHAALAIAIGAVGLAFLRPDRGIVGYLRSPDPGSAVARVLLPVALLVPLLLGVTRFEAERRELIDSAIGVTITTLGSMAIFVAIIVVLARRMTSEDTRRVDAELARRQLEAVTSRLPMAFYQSQPGPHGGWRYVSPQIEQMLGYPAEDWLRDPDLWLRAIHPDDRNEALSNERRTWIEPGGPGASGGFEYRMITAGGETIWIRDEGVLGADGYIDGILTDITGRRGAEERFRRLLEAAPDPMVIVDETGMILLVNHEVENVFGYTRDELVGKPVEILVPERLRNRHVSHRAGFAGDPTTRPMGGGHDLYARRKDGSELAVEISLSPMDADEGKLVIAAIRDVTAQRKAEYALRHLAEHDPLTGLHNRRRFEEELERTVAAAARYQTPSALMILDLDEFKEVNDTLGHAAGDGLLVSVADALRGRLRETDLLARLGGDEFAVILTHVGPEEAHTVAASMLETIRREARVEAMPDATVTVSIGVVLIEPGENASAEALLSRADIAMYEAKRTGRDRYAVYGEGDEPPTPPSRPRAVARAGGSRRGA